MSASDIMAEVSSALGDVRWAYRLLWLYQRRVNDIFKLIAKQFMDAEFYIIDYYYGGPPKRDRSSMESTWRMLPMSQVHFLYCRHAPSERYPKSDWSNFPKSGDYLTDLYLISDTALGGAKGDADPTTFPPIRQCK
jgi:hypothetical protein